jgi:pimeloyl-ACP methyl ester carboxylesterase
MPPIPPSNTRKPRVKEEVITILGWPTDTVSVDYTTDSASEQEAQPERPHTLLVFVPGNPGCIGWYIFTLVELVSRLGRGFAARGISYAGHGTTEDITNVQGWLDSKDRDTSVPWTVAGQIKHKIAYIDVVISELRGLEVDRNKESKISQPRFIFLSHSIGSHMVQRLLVSRSDILNQTLLVAHLMPFTRMDAPRLKQILLNLAAATPETAIGVSRRILGVLKFMPHEWVDCLMQSSLDNKDARDLAVKLLRQPLFARNFFELGTEEIRDVPERIDASALRIIGKQCETAMLYCGGDHWAPYFHQDDLKDLQSRNVIPKNIAITHMNDARHDYVSYDHMVPEVVNWCFESIEAAIDRSAPRSRL